MKSYRYDYARDDKMAWVDDGPEPTRKRKGLLVQVQAVAQV